MATGNNANIGFEKQIWDAACVLWGHIPAAEYRKVIVGLIFLRYISSAFEKRYQQLVDEGDGFEDDKDAYSEDNIFFVPEDARWSKIASRAHTKLQGDEKSSHPLLMWAPDSLPWVKMTEIPTQKHLLVQQFVGEEDVRLKGECSDPE